jgi:hypothetical protein
MNAKYADVLKTADILTFLDSLPSGMFDLPKGAAVPGPRPNLPRILEKALGIRRAS